MTFYCPECLTNWSPYQCAGGVCPECGTGTRSRPTEPASPDAAERHKVVLRERMQREASEMKHKQFEEFCAKRDAERAKRASQPTEEIDTAAILRGLAMADAEQHGEIDLGEAA